MIKDPQVFLTQWAADAVMFDCGFGSQKVTRSEMLAIYQCTMKPPHHNELKSEAKYKPGHRRYFIDNIRVDRRLIASLHEHSDSGISDRMGLMEFARQGGLQDVVEILDRWRLVRTVTGS